MIQPLYGPILKFSRSDWKAHYQPYVYPSTSAEGQVVQGPRGGVDCMRRGRRRAMRQKVHGIAGRGQPPPGTWLVGDCSATTASWRHAKRWR
jgi:hypothetical protein